MTGFNFFKFVFDTLSLTVMGIDIDSFLFTLFKLSCLFYENFFFFPILEHSFERQLFLLFSLLKISAAYIDFSLPILHALKQLESLNQLFYFQLLYFSIYKFNST